MMVSFTTDRARAYAVEFGEEEFCRAKDFTSSQEEQRTGWFGVTAELTL